MSASGLRYFRYSARPEHPGAGDRDLLFSLLFWLVHAVSGVAVEFNLAARDILLVYFFTTIGGHGTAMANMAAVTQHYGPSHIAFIVVPLVCAFFIDLVNAVLIP